MLAPSVEVALATDRVRLLVAAAFGPDVLREPGREYVEAVRIRGGALDAPSGAAVSDLSVALDGALVFCATSRLYQEKVG